LVERNTSRDYKSRTPQNTPHVLGNCDHGLKAPRGKGGVRGLKTSSNNPDEAMIPVSTGKPNSRVSVVPVLNMRGQPLMPTTPRKASRLLDLGKAKVFSRTPFVIQLLYATGENKQSITLGVDSGYTHVGVSAITEKKEPFSAEILLRTDMVDLNSERKMYRRNRRNRKTWYRQPRFLNRKKPTGWLAPSIQHKLDSQVRLVTWVNSFLPITNTIVETAAFDIQKIQNPEISGVEYQEGPQKDFWNTREYCFYRDDHTCQHCKGKSKDKVLNVHHVESRKTGGDRPENLITLCKTCHVQYHAGEIKLKAKKSKGFKSETFMNIVRRRLVEVLDCCSTYGYETKAKRSGLGLPKSHVNDAFVIAGGQEQTRSPEYLIKQVRKQNRKLYKGPHSGVKNTASRFVCGFERYSKVDYKGKECYVFGRRATGYFDLRLLDGTKVHASAKAQDCKLLESASTWLITLKRSGVSSPT